MENKNVAFITVLLVLVFVGLGYYLWQRDSSLPDPVTPTSTNNNTPPTSTSAPISTSSETPTSTLIRVSVPTVNQMVTSPIRVTGEARGNWYFEASFPLRVLDSTGVQIGVGHAEAQGEWMTTEFVPFMGTITFTTTTSATGTLVFEKDNPSGLSENAHEVRIPIRFR